MKIDNKITKVSVVTKESQVPVTTLLDRPEEVQSITYKVKVPDSDAMYITIGTVDNRPFEIFINSKNMQHYQWVVALTRIISAVFRQNKDVMFLVEELEQVFDPTGGFWYHKKFVKSIVSIIGSVIRKHIETLQGVQSVQHTSMLRCPKCQELSMIKSEGCEQCTKCDYSKCG